MPSGNPAGPPNQTDRTIHFAMSAQPSLRWRVYLSISGPLKVGVMSPSRPQVGSPACSSAVSPASLRTEFPCPHSHNSSFQLAARGWIEYGRLRRDLSSKRVPHSKVLKSVTPFSRAFLEIASATMVPRTSLADRITNRWQLQTCPSPHTPQPPQQVSPTPLPDPVAL
jgi:hypothetical protein